MAFQVGQKVVCINDEWADRNWKYVPNKPALGGVYTIRGFANPSIHPTNPSGARIWLAEITNPIETWVSGTKEGSFPVWRFRPVVESKTDISIFTKMLTPKQKQAAE